MADDTQAQFVDGPREEFVNRPNRAYLTQTEPVALSERDTRKPGAGAPVEPAANRPRADPLIVISPLLLPLEQSRLDAHLTVWPELQGDLKKIIEKQPKWSELGVGIVALGKEQSRYAALNDANPVPGLSVAKLAPLYAAFQLRADARAVVRDDPNRRWDPRTLAEMLKRRWNDSAMPPVTRLLGASRVQPALDKIFDVAALTKDKRVEFAGWAPLHDEAHADQRIELADVHDSKNSRAGRSFYELVWLMARWSDDRASTLVIKRIGNAYIAALMVQSGLWRDHWEPIPGATDSSASQDIGRGIDPQGGAATNRGATPDGREGGLFLRDAYDLQFVNLPGFPGMNPSDKKKKFHQEVNARALAIFMTCLHRGWLVDHEACETMKLILDKTIAPLGARSIVHKALRDRRPVRTLSKIGYVKGTYSDCALVLPMRIDVYEHPYALESEDVIDERAKQASTELQYVLVILEDLSAKEGLSGEGPLLDLTLAVDIALAKRAAGGE